MKKIVSLVDRGAFDNTVYPQDETRTLFQPTFKPYHNFITDVAIWPFTGVAEWGKRLTFTIPQPWEVDMLSWIALRIKPFHWLTPSDYNHLYEVQDWTYTAPNAEWVWANSLGTIAIAQAEMEVDGVIVEQWSGDWCDVWSRLTKDINKGIGWDDAMTGSRSGTSGGTEDGYVYCYLPFWFSKWRNTSYPLISAKGPVRFHITLRKFPEVVRMVNQNKASCDDSPLGKSFVIQDHAFSFFKTRTVTVGNAVPTMESAEMICGVSQIDGELRNAFRDLPHEIMMIPSQEIRFSEPLKYVVGVPDGNLIRIGLPLREANGPIRQIVWFLRRKAAVLQRSDWTNYSAVLENEFNTTFQPVRPLLKRAQLMVGTAVWADEPEKWWRSTGALPNAGGIRAYGNYIYVYNFCEKPDAFDHTGSLNATRVDLRLNLEVEQSEGAENEWEVVVFLVGVNWMRFQNGLANQLFMD